MQGRELCVIVIRIKMKKTLKIIEKWYKLLQFPKKYDKEFYEALGEISIPDNVTIENYDVKEQDGKKNLLSFLYFCEKTEKDYLNAGISREICIQTLSDIVCWTEIWTNLKGELYLGELAWLKNHLTMRLFQIGRLQFCPQKSGFDLPEWGVKKDDNVLAVHIPQKGIFTKETCQVAIVKAKAFFAEFFPKLEYKGFTCRSWLLDPTLKELLNAESNILGFQNLFTLIFKDKSDSILKYVFAWDANRENLSSYISTSSFAEKVKNRIMKGGDFYTAFGFVEK